jgi:hypothetical protein
MGKDKAELLQGTSICWSTVGRGMPSAIRTTNEVLGSVRSSGWSAILPLLFCGHLSSAPNASFEKVGDGYAVIQDLTARGLSLSCLPDGF